MMIFDAMAREVCASRRISTNTPLQALVTLNDSVFVETAAHFAKRMMESSPDPSEQIRFGYRLMMHEDIPRAKLEILMKLYENVNQKGLIKTVAKKSNEELNAENAMILVANTMLNLDEFLMKN